MAESELYAGIVTTLLDKFAEPIVNGLIGTAKSEWEKFKIDFDIAFRKYLVNSVEKYGKIKTILYRTEPKPIYDFFECPDLCKEKGSIISGETIDNILDVSNFVIIQGTGGIGKSTFLKHLFMDEIKQKGFIPVFIELKDLNSIKDDYEITDFIFQRLYNLGSTLGKTHMEYALQSGCFLFLLDGYDEIATDKKDVFFRKLDAFCDRFPDNCFIISSRPYSEFVEFQRFTVLTMCNLSKEQALSLIRKIEFDQEIKDRFLCALDENLYDRHQSFASNPLLLNIMLLTFDNYAEIPEKLHLFYSNAFETLYSKHDATKAGYRRELRCSLSYDSFKKVFAYFCFITYYQDRIEFTHEEILTTLKKVLKATAISFEPMDFVFDLVNSICVLCREGLTYKFTHRSFQEYFTAIFLKGLSDQSMQKMGVELVKKDYFKASHDSVFSMLRDMAEQRFELNILLPIITEFEEECVEDKYDFYFQKLSPMIEFDYDKADMTDKIRLYLIVNFTGKPIEFIYTMSGYYFFKSYNAIGDTEQAGANLKTKFLDKNKDLIGRHIKLIDYRDDSEIYGLFKKTWIGLRLQKMADLRETIEQRHRAEELDLSGLLEF